MLSCPSCNVENFNDSRYCFQCGLRLNRSCSSCSELVSCLANFCTFCGLILANENGIKHVSTDSLINKHQNDEKKLIKEEDGE